MDYLPPAFPTICSLSLIFILCGKTTSFLNRIYTRKFPSHHLTFAKSRKMPVIQDEKENYMFDHDHMSSIGFDPSRPSPHSHCLVLTPED